MPRHKGTMLSDVQVNNQYWKFSLGLYASYWALMQIWAVNHIGWIDESKP